MLLLVELFWLLLMMELLLDLLFVESVVHWWPLELFMVLLLLFVVRISLWFMNIWLVWWLKLVAMLLLTVVRFLELAFFAVITPGLLLSHAHFDGYSHLFLLFSLRILSFIVQSFTFSKSFLHVSLLFCAVSFLCDSESLL